MSSKEINLKLKIGNVEVDDKDYLYELTEELQEQLQILDLEVEMEKGEEIKGTKGDPFSIGTLLITAFSSGAITALFNLIREWIKSKKKDIRMTKTKKTPDGQIEESTLEINNANVDSKNTKEIIKNWENELKE